MKAHYKLNIFNAISFQIGWLICVLTSNWLSLSFTLAYVALHLFCMYKINEKTSWRKEFYWLGLFLIVGFICESLFFNHGILINTHPKDPTLTLASEWFIFPPIWLLCLWCLFGLSLRTSLAFIFNKPLIAYPLIMIGAPSSYYAGAHLNQQVELGLPLLLSLPVISVTWLLAFLCVYFINNYYFKGINNDL